MFRRRRPKTACRFVIFFFLEEEKKKKKKEKEMERRFVRPFDHTVALKLCTYVLGYVVGDIGTLS